jgi:signal transduction histidine kinase
MFKQGLLNLLLNAEQAMPAGGDLTLQAFVEPAAKNGASHVCLALIDTGKGMKPEVLRQVFRPFFSTRQGGTGLGLPYTRKIIEAHGGTIDVESEVDKGTKFTLRLPVHSRT